MALRTRIVGFSPFLLAALVLGQPGESWASPGSAPSRVEIAHGQKVESCGFAPVILGPRQCTATLVHPKVVICAAHCVAPIQSVTFGESARRPGRKVAVEYCKKHPGHPSKKGNDWSFCVLKEEVTDLPVIPPAFGCELEEFLKVGQKVTQVGFGANAGKHGQSRGGGTKRWAHNEITEMKFTHEDNIKVGPNPDNVVACPGDSGGPLLVKVKDGSWRSVAIASKYSGNCGDESPFNIYARMGKAVQWIEKESKIDITPCFDSDGTWNPTKECGGFYAGDASAQGDWDQWCQDAPKSGYSSTCGEPFGGGQDPKISVDSPQDKSVIEVESLPAKVTIRALLDGKQPESFTMGIVVDGEEIQDSAKSKGPYEWDPSLEEGAHTLALWYDIGKRKREQTEPISIEVVHVKPESSPEDEEGDEDSQDADAKRGKGPKGSEKPSGKGGDSEDPQEESSPRADSKERTQASKRAGCRASGEGNRSWTGAFALLIWILRPRRQRLTR